MLGDDADAQREGERSARSPQREDDLVVARARNAELPPERRAGKVVFRILQNAEREQHVVGGEGFAVCPLDAIAKGEGVGEVIGRHGPVCRQQTHNSLVGVHCGQPLVDHAVHVPRGVVLLEQWIQRTRRADQRLHRAAAFRRLGQRGDGLAGRDGQHRDEA